MLKILTANDFLARHSEIKRAQLPKLYVGTQNKLQQRQKDPSQRVYTHGNWHIEKTHSRYPRMLDTPYRDHTKLYFSRYRKITRPVGLEFLKIPYETLNSVHGCLNRRLREVYAHIACRPYSSSIKKCAPTEVHHGKNVNQCNST